MKQRNVLICPLDWGLGHATRCIPIIRILLDQGCKVYVAADGRPMNLLQYEFPGLHFILLPSYKITYPKGSGMILKMFRSIPRILKGINREHESIDQIVKSYNISLVISDNRWGLFSSRAYSVFMTHQVTIKTPWFLKPFERFLYLINIGFMKRYNECWIPDYLGKPNLSGDLSHQRKLPKATYFIGPLSRFYGMQVKQNIPKFDLLVILSGPEPQRTVFENIVKYELEQTEMSVVIVRGVTEVFQDIMLTEKIRMINYVTTEKLFDLITSASLVLSRPGYSTVMDLAAIGKQAVFVPTPGQTEQEYLARYLREQHLFYSVNQAEFNIQKAIKQSENFRPQQLSDTQNVIEMHLNSIFQKLDKKNL